MSNEQTMNKLSYLEKGIKASDDLRQRALTKKSMYEQQLKEADVEFGNLGTTAEQAPKEIQMIDEKINSAMANIEQMIPFELLREYNLL